MIAWGVVIVTEDLEVRVGARTLLNAPGQLLRVQPGDRIGLVGRNGAGKTTTMRMIMGVLASHGGEIRWRDAPVTATDRRGFGYMPEERGLYPKQPVYDQLVYLARLQGRSAYAAKKAAR